LYSINYANEKLQKLFNDDLFQATQKEYIADGVPWTTVEYSDNSAVIDLIEKKGLGILAYLNAQCVVLNGSDKGFESSLRGMRHAMLSCGRTAGQFSINHYAGLVTYTSLGFVERNKDTILPSCASMMNSSSKSLVRDMFTSSLLSQSMFDDAPSPRTQQESLPVRGMRRSDTSKRRGSFILSKSVSTQFTDQLHHLIDVITTMRIQYVRCIKRK
jgi:myosin heavy subunit